MNVRSILFLSFIVLGSCKIDKSSSGIVVQNGLFNEKTEIQLYSIKLDSVQFTDGDYDYILAGVLRESENTYPFSLMLDRHPTSVSQNNLIKSSFPFPKHAVDSMRCWVFRSGDQLEILWENPTKRLRILIDETILEH